MSSCSKVQRSLSIWMSGNFEKPKKRWSRKEAHTNEFELVKGKKAIKY
jgi:hypothetical protein